jgi:hypothetical protein
VLAPNYLLKPLIRIFVTHCYNSSLSLRWNGLPDDSWKLSVGVLDRLDSMLTSTITVLTNQATILSSLVLPLTSLLVQYVCFFYIKKSRPDNKIKLDLSDQAFHRQIKIHNKEQTAS